MTSPRDSATSIVFDLGNVLVTVHSDRFEAYLRQRGATVDSREQFLARTGADSYEKGQIECDEFLRRVASVIPHPSDKQEIQNRWQDMFSPDNKMLRLLRALRATHRVFILSNTNKMHWNWICDQYSILEEVDGALTSFEAMAMKPEALIFQRCEEQFALGPQRTIFIDDLPQNVDGARSQGWKGIVHRDFDDTVRQLATLGVETLGATTKKL